MINKRSKAHVSVSPSSKNLYGQLEFPAPSSASSKISKIEMNDEDLLSIYLEGIIGWLNGFFFSKLSIENTQLPFPPRLESSELFETCKNLRSTIAKIRETALKKINLADPKPKDTTEKKKMSPHSKSKAFFKQDSMEEKKISILLESTLREIKKKGGSVNASKIGLNDRCEELCIYSLSVTNEFLATKNRVKDLEGLLDSNRTRRVDDSGTLNRVRQENEGNLVQAIYPLYRRVISLQEKKQFYSLLYRHYERFIKHEEEEIRKLLDTAKDRVKRKPRFKSVALCVFASICIKNQPSSCEHLALKNLKIKLIDQTFINPLKAISLKTLPGIISNIKKSINDPNSQRSTLNALISSSISAFQKLMNDVKTVLSILLNNNLEQKKAVVVITQSLKESEDERDELEGALTRTVEYTKNLEEEIMRITADPDYLQQIGEDTEMVLELESHKKALKGLTSQYNQLERKLNEVNISHEDLKKQYEDSQRLIKELERYKNKS